jgi:hypothetical protein
VYGFNLGAELKGFDFNAFFNGQGDVQIANDESRYVSHAVSQRTRLVNVHKDVLNSWKGVKAQATPYHVFL